MTLRDNYLLTQLIEAALDQPQPTPLLVAALQKALTARQHHVRDRGRDAGGAYGGFVVTAQGRDA